MMISTRGRYALRVMIELAESESGKYIPLKDIATRQQISDKYLESIIKTLVQHGMLDGMRGKGGGYCLVKKPSEYTVGSILRLTEGTLAPVACLESDTQQCTRAGECRTLPMWQQLNKLINDYLDSVTLADLAASPKDCII